MLSVKNFHHNCPVKIVSNFLNYVCLIAIKLVLNKLDQATKKENYQV